MEEDAIQRARYEAKVEFERFKEFCGLDILGLSAEELEAVCETFIAGFLHGVSYSIGHFDSIEAYFERYWNKENTCKSLKNYQK